MLHLRCNCNSPFLFVTGGSHATLPQDKTLNALPPYSFALPLLPVGQTCSISPLPVSLNNPCFYSPFAPTSVPFSVLLHTIIVSSVFIAKYISFALHQPVTSWQIALISYESLFVCKSLLCSRPPEQFLTTPYTFWFFWICVFRADVGRWYKLPEHVHFSSSTQVALMGLCTNPWLIYAAVHEMCSEYNLELIHWLYTVCSFSPVLLPPGWAVLTG